METNVRFYSLNYADYRTYMVAALFIVGNLLLPQLCHLVPQGGMILLPIYFFTLIGAYKFGWKVGLLTAIASPLLNSSLFGMPAPSVLPAILVKSIFLAMAAGLAAQYTKKATLPVILAVVIAYQFFGGLAEWAMTGSLSAALQDIRLGIPGLLIQVFGCWAIIKYILKK